MRRGARHGNVLLGAALALVLLLTLWPIAQTAGLRDDTLSFRFGLADAVRNVLLFVPLGIALSARGRSLPVILVLAAILSACIEVAQVWIPGRYGNLSDLGSNALGALVGVALHRTAWRWLLPGPRAAHRLALAWSGALVAALLATGWLFEPALPATEYYAGWTLDLAHLEHYEGRVESARLGEVPLPNGRVADSDEVRRLLASGAPLHVELRAGPRATSLAPLFTLHDELRREILLVGAERGDLVFRTRTWAQAVSLDRPALRWTGALEDVRPGDVLSLDAQRNGRGWCLRLDDRSVCPLGFTAGSGWRLLWFPQRLPSEAAPWLNQMWLALLFLPLGLWLRRSRTGVAATGVAFAALLLLPPATGLLATPWIEIAAAAAGVAAGALLRAILSRGRPAPELSLGAGRALPLP